MQNSLLPGHSQRQCALHLDWLHRFQPAPKGLSHIGAAQKGQAQYPAGLRRDLQSYLGQAKIQKEQLHKQRCVPEQFDVDADDILQDRDPEMPDQRTHKAQPDSGKNARPADPQRQKHRVPVERQVR